METSDLELYPFTSAFRVILMGLEPSQADAALHIAAVALGIFALMALGSVGCLATLAIAAVLLAGLGIIFYFEVSAVGD